MVEAMLEPGVLTCTKCRLPLPPELGAGFAPSHCPGCGSTLWVHVFPALHRRLDVGHRGESILVEGEASCFYHPEKRAAVPCSRCGRFLCQLCDVTLGEEHVCASCMHSGQTKGTLGKLQNQRLLWDSIALAVAIIPLLIVTPTIITAPIAIVLAAISLKKPTSILRRSRWRSWVALVIGLLTALGWLAGLIYLLIDLVQ